MAKYLLAYHGGGMPQPPEEQQRVLEAWGKWYQELGQAVVDGGNPIGQTRVIASDGSVSTAGLASRVSGSPR
jgi:hypothetical protein